jgi:hypothetical protein
MSTSPSSLPNPETISSQLISIHEQDKAILDDFKKYYVLYKQNPSSNEYTQMFSSIKGNVHKIHSQLFTVTNAIQTGITDLNDLMRKLNIKIKEEKKENEILIIHLNKLNNENNGASEMIDNYQTMYNLQYFKNFTMILGIILLVLMLGFIHKKKK